MSGLVTEIADDFDCNCL